MGTRTTNAAAAALGRLGGKAITAAKQEAARLNGRKGGRPTLAEQHARARQHPPTHATRAALRAATLAIGRKGTR
jgi:hypothetical protein